MVSGIARCSRIFLSHCSFVFIELSGESRDSQFCEMKKVNAPDGVRLVRVRISSESVASRSSCFWSSSSCCSRESAIT